MSSLLNSVFGRHHIAAPQKSLLGRVHTAVALHRSRMRLAELDVHMLNDIGLDSETARIEAQRPIWDAPQAWKR